MRRIIVFLQIITGLLTIIVGIVEAQAWHQGPAVSHIVIASIFIVLCPIRIWLNSRSVIRYVTGGK